MPVSAMTKSSRYDDLIKSAQSPTPPICVVAHPCDEASLGAALEAARLRLFRPVLCGPVARIHSIATAHGFDLDDVPIVDAPHSHAAADAAV